MMRYLLPLTNLLILAFLYGTGTPAYAAAGSLKGRVLYKGPLQAPAYDTPSLDHHACGKKPIMNKDFLMDSEGGLAYTVVTLSGKAAQGGKKLPKTITLDQQGCEFRPFTVVIPVGGTLVVTNNDPALHNVHIKDYKKNKPGKTITNTAQPPKATPLSITLKEPGPFHLECDLHYWMRGWIYVTEAPLATTTNAQGHFEFKDVPPGSYTLQSWHSKAGTSAKNITIYPDKETAVEVSIGP